MSEGELTAGGVVERRGGQGGGGGGVGCKGEMQVGRKVSFSMV